MATIRKEIVLQRPLAEIWDAVADYQAVDRRVATGFVVKCEPIDGGRAVTFANGLMAEELLVTVDHAAHRLVYSARSPRLTHHSASVQLAVEDGRTRLTWMADVLPDKAAEKIDALMDQGCAAMLDTLGKAA